MRSFWAVTTVAFALLAADSYLWVQTSRLSTANKAEIVLINQNRIERIAQIDAIDLRFCRAINTNAQQNRAAIRASQKRQLNVLKLIGLSAKQIRGFLKADGVLVRRQIKAIPLINGGNCQALPTTTPPLPKTAANGP